MIFADRQAAFAGFIKNARRGAHPTATAKLINFRLNHFIEVFCLRVANRTLLGRPLADVLITAHRANPHAVLCRGIILIPPA